MIYKLHVARLAWEGKRRDILFVHNHIVNLSGWDIIKEPPYVQQKIEEASFNGIVKYSFKIINCPSISIMAERRYPKANIFHLPIVEMTITLDDVKHITRLPVIGKVVNSSAYI